MGRSRQRRPIVPRPKVTLHSSGRITLSGISYDDLRSILNAASIHHYETTEEVRAELDEAKAKPDPDAWHRDVVLRNHQEGMAWCKQLQWVLDTCHAAVDAAIRGTHPAPGPHVSLQRRWEEARDSRRTRRIIDEILREATGTPNPPTHG